MRNTKSYRTTRIYSERLSEILRTKDFIIHSPDQHQSTEQFFAKDIPTSSFDSMTAWCLLICNLCLQFGAGYNWIINSSIQKQSEIYFNNIEGYSYRVLNELWLYLYIGNGILGIYICQKNLRLSQF